MNELIVPINASTMFAHNLYIKMRDERNKIKHKNKFKTKYLCIRCRQRKMYSSNEMYHIWKYRYKGQSRVKYWEHFCQGCGDFYLDNNNVPEERIIRPEN